jgi:peptidoglycan/xylan/chitin deacetylase (PgdA/CDA1 family)
MRRHVFLTFDDGPDEEWTPRTLDILATACAHATFFLIGMQVQRAPSIVRRIAAEGHAIGNHTFSHRHPWTMNEQSARAEVRDGAAALSDILGDPPRVFRPPHGRLRRCMVEEARRLGEDVILWDRSATDWGPFGSAERIRRRLRRAEAGEIVLMHDAPNRHNRPEELMQVLPAFLSELGRREIETSALPMT